MTTDTVPKLASVRVGDATLLGVAKGSGMIEPDMATLLGYVVTDAAVPKQAMVEAFRRTVDLTFNALSIDTDTSTSDSLLLLANGAAARWGQRISSGRSTLFAIRSPCNSPRTAEGATKVVQVTVERRSRRQPGQARGEGRRQLAAREVRRARG